MWIKLLLLIGIVVVAAALTRATADARHQAVRRLLLAGFIVAAALSVLFPALLTRTANLLGVGRGADLLLYALVIAFLSYISTSYRRMNRLSRNITTLTRELTLLRAKVDEVDLHNTSTGPAQPLPHPDPNPPYDSES